MTTMYNSIQATKKENDKPIKEKGQLHQRKQRPEHQIWPPKTMHPKSQLCK